MGEQGELRAKGPWTSKAVGDAENAPSDAAPNRSDNGRGAAAEAENAKTREQRYLISRPLSFYGPALVLVAAYALLAVWEECFFIGSALMVQSKESVHWLYMLSKGAAFIFWGLAAYRQWPLAGKRTRFLLGCATVAASACCMLAGDASGGKTALYGAGAVLGGIGVGALITLWFESCTRYSAFVILVTYLCAGLFGSLLMLGCYLVSYEMLAVAAVAFGPLAAWLIYKAVVESPAASQVHRSAKKPGASMIILVLVIGAFGFVFAFSEPGLGSAPFEAGSYTAFGSTLTEIALLVLLLSTRIKQGLLPVFQIVLPLTAVSFLMFPAAINVAGVLTDFSAAATDELVNVLAVVVVADVSRRNRLSPAFLIGIAFGVKFLSVFLGEMAWIALGSMGVSVETTSFVFSVAAAVTTMVTLVVCTFRGVFSQLDMGLFESEDRLSEAEAQQESERDAASVRNLQLVQRFDLTPREQEICLLILRGDSYKQIEEELCISRDTAKSHRQSIFRKCEVHSREELEQLFANAE